MPRLAKLASSPGRAGLGPCPMFIPSSVWTNTKAYGGKGHPRTGRSNDARRKAPRTRFTSHQASKLGLRNPLVVDTDANTFVGGLAGPTPPSATAPRKA